VSALGGRMSTIEMRVSALESGAREHNGDARATRDQLAGLHRDFAVIVTKLGGIEASIARIEAQREKGGDRARDTIRTVIGIVTLLVALAAFGLSIAKAIP
jgi:hypothetical protein